ncbi:MAG: hypothetical protein WB810_11215 [Candidatus Cybelea sp.]
MHPLTGPRTPPKITAALEAMQMTTPSFAHDIRPMFTEMDVEHMQGFGLDLSDYAAVKKGASTIFETVSSGSMPPPGSGEARWTSEMCDTFKRWQDAGCPP